MTAIADFEQRWRQRGKTPDCSFNIILVNCIVPETSLNILNIIISSSFSEHKNILYTLFCFTETQIPTVHHPYK